MISKNSGNGIWNKKKVLILAAGALLFLSVTAQAEPRGAQTGDDELLMRSWIQTVASDAFGGRKPMTPHEDLTINYLSGELEKLGLEPSFDGSWFQPFQMLSVTARLEGDKITVKGKKKAQLKYPEDLIVWTARAADKVEIPKAEFVFCGFGFHAPEFGWADGFLNLCEVKYAKGDYALTKAEAEKIDNRVSAFQQETSTDKNILVTLITFKPVKENAWTDTVSSFVTLQDLFV